MKSCYTEEEINRYIDGELNPGEVEKMKEHLKGCGGCAAVFENLRDIGVILRTYREKSSANSGRKGRIALRRGYCRALPTEVCGIKIDEMR